MNHFALNGVISPQELYYYALRAVAMLIVIPFHESAHALISWKLGDSTAKDMGRLSMNPLRHFDPLGALCMIAAGVGWAKPVGINPTRFKNPKRGMAVSAAAGPLSNFLLAYAAMLLYKVVYYACGGAAPQLVLDFLYVLISMNISLGVFNLIPVPPCCCSCRKNCIFRPCGMKNISWALCCFWCSLACSTPRSISA